MAIPGYKLPWYKNPALGALVADAVIALGAAYAATIALTARGGSFVGFPGAVIIAVFAAALIKATLTWNEKAKTRSHVGLEGCLYTLHTVLRASAEQGVEPDLRLTMHVPVNAGKHLEQVLDYVSDDAARRKGAGRKTSEHKGLIGRVYRTREPFTMSRETDDYDEYLKELVNSWHYTLEEAKALDHRCRSFMGVPFTGDDGVEAVLYIDSTKPDYFTANRQKLVEDACTGIALFIARAYT